jgi:hypothetical protein
MEFSTKNNIVKKYFATPGSKTTLYLNIILKKKAGDRIQNRQRLQVFQGATGGMGRLLQGRLEWFVRRIF